MAGTVLSGLTGYSNVCGEQPSDMYAHCLNIFGKKVTFSRSSLPCSLVSGTPRPQTGWESFASPRSFLGNLERKCTSWSHLPILAWN